MCNIILLELLNPDNFHMCLFKSSIKKYGLFACLFVFSRHYQSKIKVSEKSSGKESKVYISLLNLKEFE